MRLLYLSYWNLSDPLTAATVYPNLELLCSFEWITEVLFVNIEREQGGGVEAPSGRKIVYRPYYSKGGCILYAKVTDFRSGPRFISDLVAQHKTEAILGRGAPAGALAFLVSKRSGIPFFVESFEPHANYMLESNVWRWYDPRYLTETYFERKQKKHAAGLMPVSENYAAALLDEGLPHEKIMTVPCTVNVAAFSFSASSRKFIREKFGISEEAQVGVYAGKYGGLYLAEKAFEIYKAIFSFFGEDFRLIILTPDSFHEWVREQIVAHGLPSNRIFVKSVLHAEVPAYLSASDFALCTYSPGVSKKYLSPVKIGEYWANGLPILLTEGIGDEHNILLKKPWAGVLFASDRINELQNDHLKRLSALMFKRIDPENRIAKLVPAYRGEATGKIAYEYFLKDQSNGSRG